MTDGSHVSGEGSRVRRPSSAGIAVPGPLHPVSAPVAEPDTLRAIGDLAAAINQLNLNLVALNGRFDLVDQRIKQVEASGERRGKDLERKIETEVRSLHTSFKHENEMSAQESDARRATLEGRVKVLEDAVTAVRTTGTKILWVIGEKILTYGLPWGAIAALWFSGKAGPP